LDSAKLAFHVPSNGVCANNITGTKHEIKHRNFFMLIS
jgi:hypothetical protein